VRCVLLSRWKFPRRILDQDCKLLLFLQTSRMCAQAGERYLKRGSRLDSLGGIIRKKSASLAICKWYHPSIPSIPNPLLSSRPICYRKESPPPIPIPSHQPRHAAPYPPSFPLSPSDPAPTSSAIHPRTISTSKHGNDDTIHPSHYDQLEPDTYA